MRKRRGAALILTLIAIAIVAALAAGIGSLVVGHLASATTDRDAVRALHLAETGLSFQTQRISSRMNQGPMPYDGSNYSTATYGTKDNPFPISDFFPASVMQAFRLNPTETISCRTWLRPVTGVYGVNINAVNVHNVQITTVQYIESEATVNGVRRRLIVRPQTVGVFDRWACFGINTLYLRNPGITINGTIGTNRYIRPSYSGGAVPSVQGITLHGASSSNSGLQTPSPVIYQQPVPWPTIGDIANQEVHYIKQWYLYGDPPSYKNALPSGRGIASFRSANDNSSADCQDASGSTISFPSDGNIPSGATVTLSGAAYGANYYMTGLKVGGSNGTLKINANQPVSLWIDSSSTGEDEIRSSIILTSGSSYNFRIYYRNASGGRLLLNGQSGGITLPANIYAYDSDDNMDDDANDYPDDYDDPSKVGTVEVTGNVTLEGSLIAETLDLSSNHITVTWVRNPGTIPGEGILFYGFLTTTWQEFDPVRGN